MILLQLLSGEEIAAIRKQAEMTQRDFAKIMGVTNATINRWELSRRRPSYKMMERLNELAKKYNKPRKEMAAK